MAPWVKVPAMKHEDPSSTPSTNMVEEVTSDLPMRVMYAHVHTCRH